MPVFLSCSSAAGLLILLCPETGQLLLPSLQTFLFLNQLVVLFLQFVYFAPAELQFLLLFLHLLAPFRLFPLTDPFSGQLTMAWIDIPPK